MPRTAAKSHLLCNWKYSSNVLPGFCFVLFACFFITCLDEQHLYCITLYWQLLLYYYFSISILDYSFHINTWYTSPNKICQRLLYSPCFLGGFVLSNWVSVSVLWRFPLCLYKNVWKCVHVFPQGNLTFLRFRNAQFLNILYYCVCLTKYGPNNNFE